MGELVEERSTRPEPTDDQVPSSSRYIRPAPTTLFQTRQHILKVRRSGTGNQCEVSMIAKDMCPNFGMTVFAEETSCSVENHLKPVQLLLRGSDQDSVAVIYPCQNEHVNQCGSRCVGQMPTDESQLTKMIEPRATDVSNMR